MNQTFKTQPAADQPVTFNETLGGSQVLFGGFSDLLGGSTFLPVAHDATGLGLSVQGSIDQPGDTVDVTFRSQFGTLRGHATYEGYYSVGSEQVFVFHPSFEFPGLGSAFAITRDGQAVPGAHDPIPLDTGTADTCFLRGTMIGTARGAVAVEDLVAGDEVSVMEHGRAVSRPVSWIGRQHRSVDSRHAATDAYPVRIRAGAFREEVPHRDLLVTAEHCVFVDGMLIPARMLVNDRSIVVDRSVTAFDYFHVELDRHGILVAEGLETESYLDTGNRGTFANGAANTAAKSWAEHAAAPLTVDRAAVEPVWNRLTARAAERPSVS
ncbi:MAG: Hint domain-containing protein, partial [Gluconacetobacter diazotrophicus]|nr:Hint domain-containing protein [Gluconacetobacter diazotrophicus]